MKHAFCESNYENSRYLIYGFPLEATTSFRRGTSNAPNSIRIHSRNFESYHWQHGYDLRDTSIHDYGDIDAWMDSEESIQHASSIVKGFVEDGKTTVMLGGEHTASLAAITATKPDIVVSLDAHLDLKESYQGNRYSHACTMRRALEHGVDLVVVGARSGTKNEIEFAEENNVVIIPPGETTDNKAITEALQKSGEVYLSIDMDVVDPSEAMGVGTPSPHGMSSDEVRDVVSQVAPVADHIDIVEASPGFDNGESSMLAASFIRDYISKKESV